VSSKILYVYKSLKLFEILEQIKENLNFEIKYIDNKDVKNLNFDGFEDYLTITVDSCEDIQNCKKIVNLPKKFTKLIEDINLSFIKKQFSNQSELKIGKYVLDLNSRKIISNNISLDLTEKESNLLIFIKENKKVKLEEIQKKVWGYSTGLETHTVETHIYRLRKKILKSFNDHNFIEHDKEGYFLN
tara:strand:+ start:637 stop:1197 length:561 start_codon:yes stop_codon:yes gene_type:complete